MKDFLGNELEEGDAVVCAVPHGRNSGASLAHGKVIGFTPQFVLVECGSYIKSRDFSERRISSDKIIKV